MVLDYNDDEAAAAMEASYRGRDVVAQRAETLMRLAIAPGESVLDIGSGPGFLATQIAEQTGPEGSVLGVDVSQAMVRRSTERNDKPWVSYVQGDATNLPTQSACFDAVVSTQVAEYMPDLAPYCTEIARVLKPGGRALILTTDWDGVRWHSQDPARMARILDAHRKTVAQSNVPRVLAPYLQAAGLVVTDVSCFEIVNLDQQPGAYSANMTQSVASYARAEGLISEDDLAAWAIEQDELVASGAYFYSVGRYIFEVRKPV